MEISVPYAYKIIKQLNEEFAGVSCSSDGSESFGWQ